MGAGSICVQFPLFGSCRSRKRGSVLIGIWPAGYESRPRGGCPQLSLAVLAKGRLQLCVWLPGYLTPERQAMDDCHAATACNWLLVAQPLRARLALLTAQFFCLTDYNHNTSNFNLELFIMYRDLSTQISASEPPHTPGVALDREDDWEAQRGWYSGSKSHRKGWTRVRMGSLDSEPAVWQGIWGWNLCDSQP